MTNTPGGPAAIPYRPFLTLTEVVTCLLDGEALTDAKLEKSWAERSERMLAERGYNHCSPLADLEWLARGRSSADGVDRTWGGPYPQPEKPRSQLTAQEAKALEAQIRKLDADARDQRECRARTWLANFGGGDLERAIRTLREQEAELDAGIAINRRLYRVIGQLAESGRITIRAIEVPRRGPNTGVHADVPDTFFHRPFFHEIGTLHGTIVPAHSYGDEPTPLDVIFDPESDLRSSYRFPCLPRDDVMLVANEWASREAAPHRVVCVTEMLVANEWASREALDADRGFDCENATDAIGGTRTSDSSADNEVAAEQGRYSQAALERWYRAERTQNLRVPNEQEDWDAAKNHFKSARVTRAAIRSVRHTCVSEEAIRPGRPTSRTDSR